MVSVLKNGYGRSKKDCVNIVLFTYPDLLHYLSLNDSCIWYNPYSGENTLTWDDIIYWCVSSNKNPNANWAGLTLRLSA